MLDHRRATAAIGLNKTILGELVENALDGDPADLELLLKIDTSRKPVPWLERPPGDPLP